MKIMKSIKKLYAVSLLMIFSEAIFASSCDLTEKEIKDIQEALMYIAPAQNPNRTIADVYSGVDNSYKHWIEKPSRGMSVDDLVNERSNLKEKFILFKKHELESKKIKEIEFLIKTNNLKIALNALGFDVISSRSELEERRKRLLVKAYDDENSLYTPNQINNYFNIIKNYTLLYDEETPDIKTIFKAFNLNYSQATSWDNIEEMYNFLQKTFGEKSQKISDGLKRMMDVLKIAQNKNELPCQKNLKNKKKEIKESLELFGLNDSPSLSWDKIEEASNSLIQHFEKNAPSAVQELKEAKSLLQDAQRAGLFLYQLENTK